MKRHFYFFLIFVLSLTTLEIEAQSIPDFANLDIKELSDTQLQSLMRRSKSLGLDTDELVQMAQLQGLSLEDTRILESRLRGMNSRRVVNGVSSPSEKGDRSINNAPDFFLEALFADSLRRECEVFGCQFFGSKAFLSFEPEFNLTAPEDYKLGKGDQLYIDIYGESEQYFEATINNNGQILVSNIGPISIQGKTLAEAKVTIQRKFIQAYPNLAGSDPTSFLAVSLGNIRTIQVNIAGEVNAPGSYKVSAFNTAFNAIYLAGGITDDGTYRSIKHFRNSRLLQTIDLYDFLINGVTSSNLTLESGDVIMVGPYTNRVEVEGAVKRPAIFEVKEEETLEDLLKFAGGYNENANKKRLALERIINSERKLTDVFEGQLASIPVRAGDKLIVDQVLNRINNRVQIQGAVYRPGNYSLDQASTLKTLIERSEGVTGDAYMSRGYIIRTNNDYTIENIPFSPEDVMNGVVSDIDLRREDVVQIISRFDLEEERYVEVLGEVNKPVIIPFREDLTITDALLESQGLKFAASLSNLEISRIKLGEEDQISEIFIVGLNEDLTPNEDFVLQPYDKITVRRKSNFEPRISVELEGEIMYPGSYSLETRTDRISDVLNRAGGLKTQAYPKGATLIRRTEKFNVISENEQQIQNLQRIKAKLDSATLDLSENELLMRERIADEIQNLQQNDKTRSDQFTNQIKGERLENIRERNGLESNVQVGNYETVAIRLDRILQEPGGSEDLLLEDGDIVVIPKRTETVRLRGSVVFPTTLKYGKGKKAKYYINRSGGFASRAKRGHTYVIYANGEVARTKRFLFFKSFPKVEPGADIIVPTKGPKNPIGVQQALAITSGLATVALLLSQINF